MKSEIMIDTDKISIIINVLKHPADWLTFGLGCIVCGGGYTALGDRCGLFAVGVFGLLLDANFSNVLSPPRGSVEENNLL